MTITLPKKALSIKGYLAQEEDEEILPEVNDPVSFHAEGIVKSVSGDTCEVELRFINGERPTGSTEKKSAKTSSDDEMAQLRNAAEKADTGEEEA